MFNKTDEANKSNAKRGASLIPSESITNLGTKVSNNSVIGAKRTGNSPLALAADAFRSLSLGRKATIVAIAIGTLPILAIGAFAYSRAHDAIKNKISKIQEAETIELADKVNLFVYERYKDIQNLSELPFFTLSRLRSSTTNQEKQSVLESFYQNNSIYENIAILNTDGEVIAQTKGSETGNESNLSYFQAVVNSNATHISQPEIVPSTKQYSVYIAAPIKDVQTEETVYILRARMPVTSINEIIKNYTTQGHEYQISNSKGKIFLSLEKEYIGKSLTQEYSQLFQGKSNQDILTQVSNNPRHSGSELVTYLPPEKQLAIKNFPKLRWSFLLAQDTGVAFEAQNRLWLTMILGTGVVAIAVAAIATWIAKKAIRPILEASNAVARLGEGKLDTRLKIDREDELGLLSSNINYMAGQLQTSLQRQETDARMAKVLANVTLQMRQSLNATDIVNTAVQEIRTIVNTNRVIIYEFDQKTWEGSVIAESVDDEYPKMIDERIDDPCFRERQLQSYLDGKVRAIADIHTEADLSNAKCYVDMLSNFAVKANLIAPIITDNQLLGLLIAHQCDSPRNWQESEIEFFRQIAAQVGYALEQSKLLEKVEKGKLSAESESQEERRQKEELQLQLLELLSEVEGAASGDLTVRAEVTAGEIGTVADFFNSIVESLREIVTQVKDTANQVNTAIGSNEGAISELAQEALSQTTEINNTLDAVDQMTESMREVAYSAQEAANVAQNASVTANQSGEAMDLTVQNIMHLRETVGETAKKVKRLGESMQQITRVVALINQISMQTNLLAINAGIEAARAGEEGQGFAVVAEEVGELAARSASATKEIEQIVENIQRETSELAQAMEVGTTQVVEGTRIVEDAKNSLSQILEVSVQIDSLVKSISTATASQAETSQTISQLMKQIANVSQRTSTSSHQVSASLQQTVKISQELQKTVGTFKVS